MSRTKKPHWTETADARTAKRHEAAATRRRELAQSVAVRTKVDGQITALERELETTLSRLAATPCDASVQVVIAVRQLYHLMRLHKL
jgi:hypothetical protein